MKNQFLPWSLWALSHVALADTSLPYNPTAVLTWENSTTAYILSGSSSNANQGTLQALDVSGQFSVNKLSIKTVSQTLPFLNSDTLVPYVPIIDGAGNITVVTGSCDAGPDGTTLWRYSGGWAQHNTSGTQLSSSGNLVGVNYLSNGVAFTAGVADTVTAADFYVFGGMCPESNSTAATWQSDAEYSQTMLEYASGDGNTYDISNTAARGPPIPEAGFSMTGLTPTFRVNTTGNAQTQQRDFLLFGGHTQDAFLNTSQVAMFSLPQNSWSFLPVQQPSATRTDLAARSSDVSAVEPRSGHTAVLSQDGSKIIIIGGWVGDVSNPAQPQLAILNLGSEYGGDEAEAWTWTVPDQTGSGIAAGTGLYGHGAAMLPGGVVMIVGGYTIPAASSSRYARRQAQLSDQILLYNATANQWIDSYTNPSYTGQASASTSGGGALSKKSQQTGLGLGLGLGVLVLVLLILAYFWYSRRLQKKREEREQALVHSAGGSFMALDQPFLDHGSVHDRRNGPYSAVGNGEQQMQQAASTGLFVNVPSSLQGLASRPYSYHKTARYDDSQVIQGSGNIHPILERQDEDDVERASTPRDPFLDQSPTLEPGQVRDRFSNAEAKLQELQRVLHSGTTTSPVRDSSHDVVPNPLGSHPHSPQPANAAETLRRVPTFLSRHQVIERKPVSTDQDANWEVIEHEYDELPGSSSGNGSAPASWTGRMSPTKTDERTSSTLSDQSSRSHTSTNSITRTMSTRTGAAMVAALARREADTTPCTSPLATRTGTMTTTASSSGRKSPYYFLGAHTESQRKSRREAKKAPALEPIQNADQSTESFMTAHSSFIGLQQEGKSLLGGSPVRDRDDPYQRALAAHGMNVSGQKSEAEASSVPHRRQGWMGSIRRALTTAMNERSFSMTSQSKHAHDEVDPRTSASSPTRMSGSGLSASDGPRRTVSDGGALLKQKRGQKDWDGLDPYRDDPNLAGDWGEEARTSLEVREAENEWDVEGAAAKRDFQVMFTVPKSRLRVVNADIERASMRSASDGAISRKESMLSLNARNHVVAQLSREGSVNTVRSRSGGDIENSQMELRLRGIMRAEERNTKKAV